MKLPRRFAGTNRRARVVTCLRCGKLKVDTTVKAAFTGHCPDCISVLLDKLDRKPGHPPSTEDTRRNAD